MINILICSANMSIVAMIFLIVSLLLRNRQAPSIRYYSWLVILAGFLLPVRPQTGTAVVTVNNPSAVEYVHQTTSFNPVSFITAIYLIGAISYFVFLIIRSTVWNRTVMRFAESVPESIADMTLEVACTLGIKRRVAIYYSDIITSPMMTGLINPVILLPRREYGYDELRLIIKHELTHYKHNDLWIKLLLTICRIMHWFNPLLILIGRRLEQECEYYCDMSVTADEDTVMRKVYCESILNTVSASAAVSFRNAKPAIATNFYSPKQGLKHRLQLILTDSKRLFFGTLVVVVLLTCVSGFVIAATNSVPADNSIVETSVVVTTNALLTSYVEENEEEEEVVETTAYSEISEETTYIQNIGDKEDVETTVSYDEAENSFYSEEYETMVPTTMITTTTAE